MAIWGVTSVHFSFTFVLDLCILVCSRLRICVSRSHYRYVHVLILPLATTHYLESSFEISTISNSAHRLFGILYMELYPHVCLVSLQ